MEALSASMREVQDGGQYFSVLFLVREVGLCEIVCREVRYSG